MHFIDVGFKQPVVFDNGSDELQTYMYVIDDNLREINIYLKNCIIKNDRKMATEKTLIYLNQDEIQELKNLFINKYPMYDSSFLDNLLIPPNFDEYNKLDVKNKSDFEISNIIRRIKSENISLNQYSIFLKTINEGIINKLLKDGNIEPFYFNKYCMLFGQYNSSYELALSIIWYWQLSIINSYKNNKDGVNKDGVINTLIKVNENMDNLIGTIGYICSDLNINSQYEEILKDFIYSLLLEYINHYGSERVPKIKEILLENSGLN